MTNPRAYSRLSVLLAALLPLAASAQIGAGIANSKHNFAGIGSPQTGLCTFCHTPHQAQSQSLLWNHTLSTNTFSWGDPKTTAGTDYATFDGDTYKGGTAKCLSCHDGSIAIGDVGWWNGGVPGSPLINTPVGGIFQVGGGGDLTGNHPVAMPYPYNNAPGTYNGVATGGAIKLGDWVADPTTVGIQIFNDDGAGNISGGPVAGKSGIECTSCHDPHNGSNVQGPFFLYGTLGGTTDYICTKCHVK